MTFIYSLYTVFKTVLSINKYIMNTKKILEVIAEKEKNYSFNDYVANYISDTKELDELKTADEVGEYLQNLNEDRQITDTEVIYYHNAMDYLKENDASLNDSIELAVECGFELKAINSELLASLLQTRNNEEDYEKFINEVVKELSK